MKDVAPRKRWNARSGQTRDRRLSVFRAGICTIAAVIGIRLFLLQIVQHSFYEALASGQRELYEELLPTRGTISMRDGKDGVAVPVATNQRLAFLWADPRLVKDARATAEALGAALGYDEEKIGNLAERLGKRSDPYEPIQHRVDDATLAGIEALALPGISYVREDTRQYPEPGLGGHVLGFIGANEDGSVSGKYGIEGHFDALLTGTKGSLRSERDIAGRLIGVGNQLLNPAVDGSDIVLTIDRNIQYFACGALARAVAKHGADGGSVTVLDPNTGEILAMCGEPDFDPNAYGKVASITQFNNPAVFRDYEPGSIFKTVTIAAGIDSGAITPSTLYEDTGEVKIGEETIRNSDLAAHGMQTMTGALEESLNTGMVFAMREMGQETFIKYIHAFGFGERAGVELDTEVSGDVSSLELGSEIYAATASFGQGITVTPIQMAAAYAAVANGGILLRPTVVSEIRHADGTVEKPQRVEVRRAVEEKTARLVGAMLVSVIEHGHGKLAGVPGYYLAGKTGTAQVARSDGRGYLEDESIGSFAGFGPADNPRFVIVARIDHPRDVKWAESTAAPLFGEVAGFLLKYFEIPPTRL